MTTTQMAPDEALNRVVAYLDDLLDGHPGPIEVTDRDLEKETGVTWVALSCELRIGVHDIYGARGWNVNHLRDGTGGTDKIKFVFKRQTA